MLYTTEGFNPIMSGITKGVFREYLPQIQSDDKKAIGNIAFLIALLFLQN